MLTWYRETTWGTVQIGAIALILMAGGVTLLQGLDLTWLTYWQPWAVIAVFAIFTVLAVRSTGYSVGADWLQDRKGHWVKVYELERIIGHRGNSGLSLKLQDTDGRKLEVDTRNLKHTRLMWDLFYNGVLHSVIAGRAEANTTTRGALDIPYAHPDEEDNPSR